MGVNYVGVVGKLHGYYNEVNMARPRYFTPSEVAAHNVQSDCWVSFLGTVYNLTSLCEKHAGDILLKPIVANAGKDISHWFDEKTKDVRFRTNQENLSQDNSLRHCQ